MILFTSSKRRISTHLKLSTPTQIWSSIMLDTRPIVSNIMTLQVIIARRLWQRQSERKQEKIWWMSSKTIIKLLLTAIISRLSSNCLMSHCIWRRWKILLIALTFLILKLYSIKRQALNHLQTDVQFMVPMPFLGVHTSWICVNTSWIWLLVVIRIMSNYSQILPRVIVYLFLLEIPSLLFRFRTNWSMSPLCPRLNSVVLRLKTLPSILFCWIFALRFVLKLLELQLCYLVL